MSVRRTFLKQAGLGLLAIPATSIAANLSVDHIDRAKDITATGNTLTPGAGGDIALNVKDFGAKGDGTIKDTVAIQEAIDRCSILGGGIVTVPAGTYLTGAIALRSNTTLHLENDAVIQGSSDFKDYVVMQVRWEGKWIQ